MKRCSIALCFACRLTKAVEGHLANLWFTVDVSVAGKLPNSGEPVSLRSKCLSLELADEDDENQSGKIIDCVLVILRSVTDGVEFGRDGNFCSIQQGGFGKENVSFSGDVLVQVWK